jgi:hypothetical protein
MFHSCTQQNFHARQGWLCMIVLMVASFAWMPQEANASCGDYLQHRFGIGLNSVASSSNVYSIGLQNSRDLTKNRSVTPVPAQKRCYSCRGATLPVSVPVAPPQDRVEYLATISDDSDDCSTASFSNQVGNELPNISEGAYPSLLRPPIA